MLAYKKRFKLNVRKSQTTLNCCNRFNQKIKNSKNVQLFFLIWNIEISIFTEIVTRATALQMKDIPQKNAYCVSTCENFSGCRLLAMFSATYGCFEKKKVNHLNVKIS